MLKSELMHAFEGILLCAEKTLRSHMEYLKCWCFRLIGIGPCNYAVQLASEVCSEMLRLHTGYHCVLLPQQLL